MVPIVRLGWSAIGSQHRIVSIKAILIGKAIRVKAAMDSGGWIKFATRCGGRQDVVLLSL
jgi:hypothetical protein